MNSLRHVVRCVKNGTRRNISTSSTKKGPYSNDQWFNLKHGIILLNMCQICFLSCIYEIYSFFFSLLIQGMVSTRLPSVLPWQLPFQFLRLPELVLC